jgi:hypothetical protein
MTAKDIRHRAINIIGGILLLLFFVGTLAIVDNYR